MSYMITYGNWHLSEFSYSPKRLGWSTYPERRLIFSQELSAEAIATVINKTTPLEVKVVALDEVKA